MKKHRFFVGWRLVFAIIYVVGFVFVKSSVERSATVTSAEPRDLPRNVVIADRDSLNIEELVKNTLVLSPEK